MNAVQYKIVKSVLAVGADPVKFAKMCKAEPLEFITVQTTDNYNQYVEAMEDGRPDFSAEDMIKSMFGGSK
jgi:hypothetical protein